MEQRMIIHTEDADLLCCFAHLSHPLASVEPVFDACNFDNNLDTLSEV
jgi:hypothetical protein